jgi:hypothetical protein
VSCIGAGDEGFGRRAACVDAGAADAFALDEGDRLAGRGDPPRRWRPRLTGADHDRVGEIIT